MEFNKVICGANRAVNEVSAVYEVLDAGFLCQVAFEHEGQTMMIPTAFGRKEDVIYIHGSTKNFMMNPIINGQTVCIAVTHLDGIVLARTLFDRSRRENGGSKNHHGQYHQRKVGGSTSRL
ncbi:MAG TPA: pyridoxamine 5'-phosphate oxidase family protein [Saprospiraceae bacterium]|nr:pyridoxamine 5'-phosphate oxidase family protein [Saprospiraceae bacterium]